MEHTAIHPTAAVRSAPDLLSEIRQPVLVGLSKMLRRSLAGTIDDLLERMLNERSWQERQAIDDALDLLRNGREGIELSFDRACAQSWTERTGSGGRAGPGGRSPAGRGSVAGASTGGAALALVDDNAMGEQLIVSRIATRSRRRMDEEQVDGLRARFGALLDRDWFADNDHPVAPDVVFEALRKSLAGFGEARVVHFLLDVFEPHVSADLSTLYAELNQRLVRLGVLPEIRYQIAKQVGSPRGDGTPALASARPDEPAAGAAARHDTAAAGFVGRVQAAVGQPGHHEGGSGLPGQRDGAGGGPARAATPMPAEAVTDLVAQMGQRIQAAQGSATRYLSDPTRFADSTAQPPPSDRLLAALTSLQVSQTAAAEDPAALVNTVKAVSSAVAREHGSPLERLIIETVSLVFEHVYEDEAIADAIKQQLLRLQVAAFKAALIDPSFFARPEHPMRRFIDRIAQIGSDSDFDTDAGSPLIIDIAALTSWVLANFDRDLAIFETALARTDDIVAAESGRRAERIARIAQAAQKAEALERCRSKVRAELSAELADDTPEFVRRFVVEPWTEVVSRIASGAEFSPFDPARARRTVTTLLWSIAPKSAAEIGALAAELPQLIADLSRGLSFIAQSGAERELFFSELLAWHGTAIEEAKRAGRSATAVPAAAALASASMAAATAGADAIAGTAGMPRTAAIAGTSGMPRTAATAGTVGAAAAPLTAAAAVLPHEDPGPMDDAVQGLGLTNGTEVELTGPGGDRKRFKVGWMSPSRSIFIFSRYPRDHWTAPRATLNALAAQGRLTVVGKVSGTTVAIESLKTR